MNRSRTIIRLFVLLLFSALVTYGQSSKYQPNKLVVKFKQAPDTDGPGKSLSKENKLLNLFEQFGINKAERMFEPPVKEEISELDKIVVLEFGTPYNPEYLQSKFSRMPGIEWSEPYYIGSTAFTPNDDSLGSQWYLNKISAQSAWDVSKGDSTIIIAIVDSGVDWDHPDLQENIWNNEDEIPNNGTDDDNNGYVDDVRGWDFTADDNDPVESSPVHGTLLAGLAAAAADNSIGIAGVGYNCEIMPVKVTTGKDVVIAEGYEGIKYAVDNGAKIINVSWGNYEYTLTGEEIVQYALDHGALIVASAGNDGQEGIFYPAGYEGTLAVTAADESDGIANFSNYGFNVDVTSPGVNILSTWQDDAYSSQTGTSLSSPIVSGIAGLVWAQHPGLTPLQVAQRIRVSSDEPGSLSAVYTNKTGFGRVNANAAVTSSSLKSVRITDYTITDSGNQNGILEQGETGSLVVELKNYLNPVSSVNVSFTTSSNAVTLGNSSVTTGALASLDLFTNNSTPLTFTVNNDAPENTEVNFLLTFSEGGYNDYQWITVIVNPTYSTQSGSLVQLTINSNGSFGYNDYPFTDVGNGFTYDSSTSVLYIGGMLYGTSASTVIDGIPTGESTFSNDFTTLVPFNINIPGTIADNQGYLKLNDDNFGSGKLNIETEMNSYTFNDPIDGSYIILEYKYKNNSGSVINNFYSGLFLDFDIDIEDWTGDKVRYNTDNDFVFAYDVNGVSDQGSRDVSTLVGAGIISEDNTGLHNFYGIDNNNHEPFNIKDDFTDAEKWTVLQGDPAKAEQGESDISCILSAGPYSIPDGEVLTVAFALTGCVDIPGLTSHIQQARSAYADIIVGINEKMISSLPVEFSLSQNFPNPFNPATKIEYSIPEQSQITLRIYDILGREAALLAEGIKNAGTYELNWDASKLASGTYIYSLEAVNNSGGVYKSVKKMVLLK